MADEPVDFRERPDGTTYPIHSPKGGGSGGGKVLAALGTAVVLSSGIATGGGTIGGTTGSSAMSAAESAVVRHMGKNLTKAQKTAKRGKPKKAWRELGLRRGKVARHEARSSSECVVFSHGEIQQFLGENGCRGLNRWQVPLSYEDGSISLLVSRVRLRSTRDAGEFKRIIDRHGSGDIRPVLPDPRFTGHHYDSRRTGRTVFIAEAEPSSADVPDEVLDTTAGTAIALTRAARR